MIFSFSSPILLITSLSVIILHVAANTEKVIFTAPDVANIPVQSPTLRDLQLHLLSPDDPLVRANLTRVFPTQPGDAATGAATWLLLDHLTPSQRYELRVCWAAIQPTAFALDVYELDTVWSTPELIRSLEEYASKRQAVSGADQEHLPREQGERQSSVLLLQVRASADYFTDDAALMKTPPPVLADLILDPYFYNVIPQSLIPTIGYLVAVGLLAWFGARSIASKLQSIAITAESATKKQN
ncbi:hypothetical protein B0T10DRAFT_15296 [Thelonectria olida]|uniref:Uncharacterized protein n=1 Tax=Thelonectria olida TaxID=1576542 RepID=A0A9P8WHM5_9HYPO|nr:hypothetical protein B0T10DRAFT_15296 [Thelonectria olida]